VATRRRADGGRHGGVAGAARGGGDPFVARVEARHAELSPVQRKVLDFLLAHPHDAVYLTTTALGRELGVSEASVVRLCRTLGFDGFRDFQQAFRQYADQPLSRVSRIKVVAGRRRSLAQLADDVLVNDINNLRTTHASLDHGLLIEVAETLWKARRAYIVGVRSAHALAVFLHFALRLLGRDSRLLVPGIGDVPEQLVEVAPGDVAVGISFERYSRATIDLFEACVTRGATGIAITDTPTSPLAGRAKLVLRSQTSYLTFIDSYVAPFSLVNAVLTVLAVQRRRPATRSLERMEEAWRAMNTYL
jgi:DNA-binding MurR/RpiR family transcriptional regulator